MALLPGVKPQTDHAERAALREENLGERVYTHVAIHTWSVPPRGEWAYLNHMSPTEGTILCDYNNKYDDTNTPENKSDSNPGID